YAVSNVYPGSCLRATSMMLAGTVSIGTSSSLFGSFSQPASTITSARNVRLISIVSRDRFAAGACGQRPECRVGHRGLEKADVAVGEEKVHTAGVATIELIHLAVRVARPEPPACVSEHHARPALRSWIADAVVVPREQHSARDRAGPGRLAEAVRALAHGQGLGGAVGDVAKADVAVAEENAVAVDARIARAEHAHVVR